MMEDEKGGIRGIRVTDWDGASCNLERWFSEYENCWVTGVTVRDSEGREVMHASMTTTDMTIEAALREIELTRLLRKSLANHAAK